MLLLICRSDSFTLHGGNRSERGKSIRHTPESTSSNPKWRCCVKRCVSTMHACGELDRQNGFSRSHRDTEIDEIRVRRAA